MRLLLQPQESASIQYAKVPRKQASQGSRLEGIQG